MASPFGSIWICFIFSLSFYHLASSATFRCYRSSFTDFVEAPLEKPDALITDASSCLDVTKLTIVVAIGFGFILDGPLLTALIPTLLKLGYNVLLVNWKKEASDWLGVLSYPDAVKNTMLVGKLTGKALLRLVALGLLAEIYFIGHSLGAHLGGYSGRTFQEGGRKFKQLTALDPARLGFEQPTLYQSVDPSCAETVVSVHCDMGGYALNKTVGHVDIFANQKEYVTVGGTRLQPGCEKGTTPQEVFSSGNRCSHDRCWQFYNVSLVESTTGFIAGQASDYYDFARKNGVFDQTTYIGPLVSTGQPGKYFLTTTGTYPYYKQEEGLKP